VGISVTGTGAGVGLPVTGSGAGVGVIPEFGAVPQKFEKITIPPIIAKITMAMIAIAINFGFFVWNGCTGLVGYVRSGSADDDAPVDTGSPV
jgi:hypothetical protein